MLLAKCSGRGLRTQNGLFQCRGGGKLGRLSLKIVFWGRILWFQLTIQVCTSWLEFQPLETRKSINLTVQWKSSVLVWVIDWQIVHAVQVAAGIWVCEDNHNCPKWGPTTDG